MANLEQLKSSSDWRKKSKVWQSWHDEVVNERMQVKCRYHRQKLELQKEMFAPIDLQITTLICIINLCANGNRNDNEK